MPAAPADKVIVTNWTQLAQKYGGEAMPVLDQAIKALIAADATRGLNTVLVDLGSAPHMKKVKASAVKASKALNQKAVKQAIDKVFTSYQPAYLMILGSFDVVPHQELLNPAFGGEDTDRVVPSDLPYACDASYGTDIRDFLSPTRVVGRLPDVTNGTDVNYLVGLLNTVATYQDRPASDYDPFLGITAGVWQESTAGSLRAVFGNSDGMKLVPPDGPQWSDTDLAARSHFINCHGAPADFHFYGQRDEHDMSFPPAHDATWVDARLAEATVLAAECCYGGELYDPALAGGQMGMCNTYLKNKAYAYFGSSTIAYGPAAGNDQADLICQYFLNHIRAGSSAGRACLEARLDYLQKPPPLGAQDLKTLGQYNLMADPALTPVRSPQPDPHFLPFGKTTKALAPHAVARHARGHRRQILRARSKAVSKAIHVIAKNLAKPATAKKGRDALLKRARELGLESGSVLSFAVQPPPPKESSSKPKAVGATAPRMVHTLMKRVPVAAGGPRVIHIHGIEGIEYDGTLQTREFFSR